MDAFRTVGQGAAVRGIREMLRTWVPHALLLSGPASVGKMSLALDLAAALLCVGAAGDARPCRSCRGCRMVEHGNHGDLHVLGPEGPGGQVGIGGKDGKRGVRDLVTELALLPVEGGARVAIIREAHRMNEDAQSALLKTLEEPPAGTTLILIADDEERLLPTVRSRCARVRLGTVGARDIERLLGSLELADPPAAARLARLAGGRPGVAVGYAVAPEAERLRGELARTLLDLLSEGRAARLRAARDLLARAGTLAGLLAPPAGPAANGFGAPAKPQQAGGAPEPRAAGPSPDSEADARGDSVAEEPAGRLPASERRRALATLLDAWRDLARDLVLVEAGAGARAVEIAMLEELEDAARELPRRAATQALGRVVHGVELLDANVSPELLLDVLLLGWPRRRAA